MGRESHAGAAWSPLPLFLFGFLALPGGHGSSGEHLSITSAMRLSMLLKPYACPIATLTLSLAASTRALETPGATERTMPLALRRTFLESSANCGMRQRHAQEGHSPRSPRASSSPCALKTARNASLGRWPRQSAVPMDLRASSAAACPSVRLSGSSSKGQRRPSALFAGSGGASSPFLGPPRRRLGPGAFPASRHAPFPSSSRASVHQETAWNGSMASSASGREPVVAVAEPAAHGAARRAPPRPGGDGYGVPLDSGGLDHGPGESEAVLQYALPHAGASLGRLSFLAEIPSLSERGPRCHRHAFTGRSAHTNPRRAL